MNILPTGTRGRAWQGEISYIPKDVVDHASPLAKFDQIHAKYLTSPREDWQSDLKYNATTGSYGHATIGSHPDKRQKTDSLAATREQARIEKGLKKDKESFRTTMVNIVMCVF